MPEAKQLMDLMEQWRRRADTRPGQAIWDQMLAIYADQVFTIGTVAGVPQPVVVSASSCRMCRTRDVGLGTGSAVRDLPARYVLAR